MNLKTLKCSWGTPRETLRRAQSLSFIQNLLTVLPALGALLSALVLLSACHQSEDAYDQPADAARMVELPRLIATLDQPSLKAMGFKMGPNAAGDVVPLTHFVDGQVYAVHTALSNGTYSGSATLNWTYHSSWTDVRDNTVYHDVLVINPGARILLSTAGEAAFAPGSSGWYIAGIIGGSLNNGRVVATPQRELRGVSRTAPTGDAFDLEVPFGFPWTEILIEGSGVSRSLVFKPLGAVIGYEFQFQQVPPVTPKGFIVYSDGFGDAGSFDLTTLDPNKLPSWTKTDDVCYNGMSYTLSSQTPAGSLLNGMIAPYRYYAWVMPHSGVTRAKTYVLWDVETPHFSGGAVPKRYYMTADPYVSTTGSGVPQSGKSYKLRSELNTMPPYYP